MLQTQEAAEDATQETFVRVHRHLERAPDAAEVLPWIYRIATNYCLNQLRNHRARPCILGLTGDIPSGLGEEPLADRDLARKLVMHTPHRVRAVAWLYHVDGLTQDEIATTLGISRRTVVNRLQRFAAGSKRFASRNGQ